MAIQDEWRYFEQESINNWKWSKLNRVVGVPLLPLLSPSAFRLLLPCLISRPSASMGTWGKRRWKAAEGVEGRKGVPQQPDLTSTASNCICHSMNFISCILATFFNVASLFFIKILSIISTTWVVNLLWPTFPWFVQQSPFYFPLLKNLATSRMKNVKILFNPLATFLLLVCLYNPCLFINWPRSHPLASFPSTLFQTNNVTSWKVVVM
jgi:hypothetical protein